MNDTARQTARRIVNGTLLDHARTSLDLDHARWCWDQWRTRIFDEDHVDGWTALARAVLEGDDDA